MVARCRTLAVSPQRRAAAIALAIVPGVVLRGTGSWIVGDKRSAKKLAITAAGGLAVAGGLGGLIGLSGANPYTTVAVPLVLTGAGALLTSWAADIYVAAGGRRMRTSARATSPWSIEAGETWLHDAYRERLHARAAGRFALGRVDLGGMGLFDVGGDGWLAYGDARVRLLGAAATDEIIEDGSRLWARVGGRVQRDDDDRVTQVVGEIEVGGRLDLRHFDRALASSFGELSVGLGALHATYAGETNDLDSILLSRFAWGMYVPGGEVSLFYDHRRDGLAGGIAAYRAAGFVGSVGATADLRVNGPWAIRGELQIGNAWLTTLAFAYRGGGR